MGIEYIGKVYAPLYDSIIGFTKEYNIGCNEYSKFIKKNSTRISLASQNPTDEKTKSVTFSDLTEARFGASGEDFTYPGGYGHYLYILKLMEVRFIIMCAVCKIRYNYVNKKLNNIFII